MREQEPTLMMRRTEKFQPKRNFNINICFLFFLSSQRPKEKKVKEISCYLLGAQKGQNLTFPNSFIALLLN